MSQSTNWNEIIYTGKLATRGSVINKAVVVLRPTPLHLSPPNPPPLSQVFRHNPEKRGARRREDCLLWTKVFGEPEAAFSKLLFKCGSKTAALRVEKHCCSEGTHLPDTDREALQRTVQRACENQNLCSQPGAGSNICPLSLSTWLGK